MGEKRGGALEGENKRGAEGENKRGGPGRLKLLYAPERPSRAI